MALSSVQWSAVSLIIAVFQLSYLKSLTAVSLATPERLSTKVASCPDSQDYCEDAHDYPADLIIKHMKDQPKVIQDLFDTEKVDFNNLQAHPDETSLCPGKITVFHPKKGKTKDGEYVFIVNGNDYWQNVRTEVCWNTNKQECDIPGGGLPLGYSSQCEQKYLKRIVVVVDPNSPPERLNFTTETFEFPSCCSCKVTFTENQDRVGISPVWQWSHQHHRSRHPHLNIPL